MNKILKASEEIIPLSSRQVFLGLIITCCLFQFALFYSPALAEDAVKNINKITFSDEVKNDQLVTIDIKKDSKEAKAIEESFLLTINDLKNVPKGKIVDIKDSESLTNSRKIALLSKPEEKVLEAEVRVIRTSTHVLTAYNSEVAQTDDTPCITANGFDVCAHGIEDTIAANFLKFGTKVRIPELFGDRIFIVRDRMNKRYPDRVDVWMLNKSDAIKFGVKRAVIEVVEIIEPEPEEDLDLFELL